MAEIQLPAFLQGNTPEEIHKKNDRFGPGGHRHVGGPDAQRPTIPHGHDTGGGNMDLSV